MSNINDWRLINAAIERAVKDLVKDEELEVLKEGDIVMIQNLINNARKESDQHTKNELQTILNRMTE